MITAIPNQPINFGDLRVQGACDPDPEMPLLIAEEDTLIFQFLQDKCANALTYVVSPTFESGWLSGGEWDLRSGACADAGQEGASIENDDFDPIVGQMYQVEVVIASISGSGITVSMGGYEQTITAPGNVTFTITADTTDPLSFVLIDDTSAVCITSAQVYQGNDGIEVILQDTEGNPAFSINVQDDPEYFTYTGQHVVVILPLADAELTISCFRVLVTEACPYLVDQPQMCSQPIEVVGCQDTIYMRVCNDSDQMGFVAGRFEVRLKASLFRSSWEYEVEEERWSNGYINRHFIDRQELMVLNIQPVSGYLHPFVSAMCMFDHFYIGTTEYSIDPDAYEPIYGPQAHSGAVSLRVRPKEQLLRKVLCEPVGAGCNPSQDPICSEPQATITPNYNGSGQFVIDVVLYGLQGFAADELIVTLNGYPQAPIDFSTPQSVQLGPYSPGDVIEITITNRDGADCNYTHPAIEVPFCEGPGFGFFTTAYEGNIRIRISSSVGGASGYGGVRPPIGSDQVFVQNAFYNLNSADDSVKTYCFWQGTSSGTPQLFMDELAWDSPGYDITAINVTYLTGLTVFNAQSNLLTDLDLSTNTLLASIDVSENQLVSISLPPPSGALFLLDLQSNAFVVAPDLAGYTNLTLIFLEDNALAEVDSVIISVESNGSSNGTLSLNGGTNAAPTGTSAAALALLLGRGWTVITN